VRLRHPPRAVPAPPAFSPRLYFSEPGGSE
jgi:hypothetical protein